MNVRTATCLNCSTNLGDGQNFCGNCGQRTTPGRLSLRQVWHDLFHSFFNVDRSVLSLLRSLATRPGAVARDFVEGKRQRYFGPFSFLVIAVSVASAGIAITGFTTLPVSSSAPSAFETLVQKHVNVLYLLQVPLLAALSALLFRSERYLYAEHLVLATYASGMRAVAVLVLLLPLWLLLRGTGNLQLLFFGYSALWVCYYALAASQFFKGTWWVSVLKGSLVALLAQLLTVAGVNIIAIAI